MRNYLMILFILIGFNFFAPISYAQWEVRPEIKWKVIHSEHFDVIYNAGQQDLGLLYAEKLEKAYFQLKEFFSEAPERLSVVINDKTDLTNGYATRIPYPHIMAYPVMPGPEDSLADTGDWAFELLAHEYTHILNFEPARGIMKPLRFIFGNIIAPNLLLPTWWKEGLAVQMETRLGKHGRLRSIYQDASIRAMVDDETFFTFDLAQVNEVMPSWPEGARPYLFGSLMWSEIIAEHGDKVIDEINQRQAGRVPYFVEQPARDYFGKNYVTQYGDALKQTSELALEQLKTLREVNPTPAVIAKDSYQYLSAPAVSPDGKKLAMITQDDSKNRSVKILSRDDLSQSFLDSKKADTIEKFDQNLAPPMQNDEPMSGSIQRVSWFPDSTRLIYDKINLVNRVESFSDLHVYNFETKKTENLTRGLRAREPAVSPDGKLVAFIKLSGGKTQLATLKLDAVKKTYHIVFSPALEERVSYPTFIDNHDIGFSYRNAIGEEHLYRYNAETNKVSEILSQFPDARFAKMTSEGLIFTSSRNGTHNVYLASKDLSTAHPITHTLTAYFMSDLDPSRKDLFATTMTSGGFKIATMQKEDWEKTPKDLPYIKPLMNDRYPAVTNDSEATNTAKGLVAKADISDYSPYHYLWPQYWIPFIVSSSSDTGLVIQAQTSGFDPLKKHSYTLLGSWDTLINKGSIVGSYLNQTTSLPFVIGAYHTSSYLGDVNNQIEDSSISAAVLPDMFWMSRYASLQVGVQHFERTTETPTGNASTKRMGPFAMLAYTNYTQAGAQISPESGLGVYLGAYDYVPYEDYLHTWQFLVGGEKYFSYFLPKHHALMVRAKGVYTVDRIPSVYGVSTDSLVYIPDNPLPEYIMRGYQRGQFYGRNLVNVNLEYRFPFWNIYGGSGTDPLFIRRISGALVGDGVAADGIFLNDQTGVAESISMKRSFWSAGLEARFETTVGYSFPVTLVLGFYQAFNGGAGPENVVGTALQISGL